MAECKYCRLDENGDFVGPSLVAKKLGKVNKNDVIYTENLIEGEVFSTLHIGYQEIPLTSYYINFCPMCGREL